MTIDWNAFTPWASLAGGVLIGVAASMFALLNGRIAGISGAGQQHGSVYLRTPLSASAGFLSVPLTYR